MAKAVSFKPLTNRDSGSAAKDRAFKLPEDGFVQLVPKGEAPNWLGDGKDAKRIIQVVDDRALELIMSKLLNRGGEEMLIDDEHFSRDPDKSTDALGWQPLDKDVLINREGGLYGAPRWSSLGIDKLEGGVKRYVSPEFSADSLEHLGGNRYRVTELVGLALTNRPGFKRLQKPLTNREDDSPRNPNHDTMHKALLAGFLGLTETALDALDEPTLKNRLNAAKEKADKAVALETEMATLKNRDADAFLEEHKAVIPDNDAVKKHLRETFLANRDTAKVIADGFKAAAGKGDNLTDEQRRRAGKKPLFNRADAKTPPDSEGLKNREEARAAKIRNRATELCDSARAASRTLQWGDAWSQAESEIPAVE